MLPPALAAALPPVLTAALPPARAAALLPALTAALLPALAAALLLVLGGCAARQHAPAPPAAPEGARATWAAFRAAYGSAPDAPGLLTNASLSWRQGRKSARVILDLWGDLPTPGIKGEDVPPASPRLRMDAWSNIGGSLVHLLEDGQGIIAYYPDPPRLYTHADPVRGVLLLGLPFPFSLADLAALYAGNFGALVPGRFDEAERGPGGTWVYSFASGPVETLTLDPGGRPQAISGVTTPPPGAPELGGLWRIAFSAYDEPGEASALPALPALPGRMDLELPGGGVGILRMKARELTLAPWPDQAMVLTVPEGVEPRTLDGSPRDWTTGQIAQPEETP
ncbi:MAG: hypothetical protein AB7D51_00430 [Desulfovibrionaceae bacterium]